MIAYLEGHVIFRGSKYLLLNVGGVGYQIFATADTLLSLPKPDQLLKLYTHLSVRENAMELYGFRTRAELEFFEMLIAISGIGPKTAIGVLSVSSPDGLKRAIASGDTEHLTKVSGIGKRIAEKIVVELREKLAGSADAPIMHDEADVLDALVSLGYSLREARSAIVKISRDAQTVDEKIKAALKILGGHGNA